MTRALGIFQGIVPILHLSYGKNMALKKVMEPLFQDSFLKYMMVHILKCKKNASDGGQREEGRKKREGGRSQKSLSGICYLCSLEEKIGLQHH